MAVEILHGDCREVLAGLEAGSFHTCVTDPPYHLTSIVKRFGAENAAPAKSNGATGVYARASKGFMGKTWDGGDVAFRPETWAAVYRVLKPGAHLVAFGGTRTFHRLACAIEDAGFEIRDTIMWLYGSGFPKSHDVSKAIDSRGGADIAWFGQWLREERRKRGISSNKLALNFPSKSGGETGCVRNWELGLNLPTPEQFNKLCEVLNLPFERIEEAEREVVGQYNGDMGGLGGQRLGPVGGDITIHATEVARVWQGWGTALKPACEPIVLARKPLAEGAVAAQVLATGTGALNIDASRIPVADGDRQSYGVDGDEGSPTLGVYGERARVPYERAPQGRWPANCVHDGSPEVLDEFAKFGVRIAAPHGPGIEAKGMFGVEAGHPGYPDAGTAARFFFCAKAAASERVGSHPTVKPIALMEWLVRLVTPPGGRVLDPFCGTGSTLVACDRLGFDGVGIEQDAQTVADAHEKIRRMRARRMIGDAERVPEIKGQLGLEL